MKRSKKFKSDYDEYVSDPKRKALLEEKYRELCLSEIILGLMEEQSISVRKLAKEIGVSPAVIQDIRSGKRKNITLKNLVNITSALGATIKIQKGQHTYSLFE